MFRKTIFFVSLLVLGAFVLWVRGDLPEVKSLLETRTAGTPRIRPFNKSEFDDARRNGNKIVVIATATWNSESSAQRPLLRAIINTSKYNDFMFYDMDFDLNKKEREELFITRPATLVVYAQGQEVSRVTGAMKREDVDRNLGDLKVKFTKEDIDQEELEFAIKQAK